jgi:homotetrameric cytidine deaminase
MTDKELCIAAISAMKNSYSPYSGYKVGAALLCDDGTVYTGCNIENASFSPTVCAERVALFKAISEGKTNFTKIAVAGGKYGNIVGEFQPCGVCRQVLAEFCNHDFEVLLVTSVNEYSTLSLAELLPNSFSKKNIK